MGWSVETVAAKKFAVIPDEWIDMVIESVDSPRGFLPIDLYQDHRLSCNRLPVVIENLQAQSITSAGCIVKQSSGG